MSLPAPSIDTLYGVPRASCIVVDPSRPGRCLPFVIAPLSKPRWPIDDTLERSKTRLISPMVHLSSSSASPIPTSSSSAMHIFSANSVLGSSTMPTSGFTGGEMQGASIRPETLDLGLFGPSSQTGQETSSKQQLVELHKAQTGIHNQRYVLIDISQAETKLRPVV